MSGEISINFNLGLLTFLSVVCTDVDKYSYLLGQ